jgi:hypothetical protein
MTDQADQEQLFNVESTRPPRCKCGSTRKNLCKHDADLAYGRENGLVVTRRPSTCLNRYDQKNAEIPF